MKEHAHIELQQVIADIASRLIGAEQREMDEAITRALEQLGQWYEVDRAYLFRYSLDGTTLANTHEWCAPDAAAQKQRIQGLPVVQLPWWQAEISRLEPVHIPCVSSLPPAAATEKNEFTAQHIQSLLALPMHTNERDLIGFIGMDTVQREHQWAPEDIRLLQVVANIFSGVILRNEKQRRAEQERDTLMSSLQHLAARDAMTGLLNRRGFADEMHRTWQLSQQHPFPVGLLITDIDLFKTVNDTYGHLVGDAVINTYAALVQSQLRDTDVAARYGGDELVVILPRTGLEEARQIGERLCASVREHVFCVDNQELQITVSIGIHAALPATGTDSQTLIHLADRALYQAKRNGRNQVWS